MSQVEKPLQQGGAAHLNIVKYYEAALLTACLDWWNFTGSSISLAFEQESYHICLADWLF